MELDAKRFGSCPNCQALNMAHRSTCYRCGADLSHLFESSQRALSPMRPMLPDTRGHRRRGVRIGGVVVEGQGVLRHTVTVYDMSAGGLQFRTPIELRGGTLVRLRIPVDGQIYSFDGVVRYVGIVPRIPERMYACGVEFAEEVSGVDELLQAAQTQH